MKHAPIGPTIAVGDARPDGTVYVHTHNQNPQALRGQIAMMLGTPIDNVVVRIYAGPGPLRPIERRQRRRRGRGGDPVEGGRPAGARAVDAARRSAVVHAVAAGLSDIQIGWDASGKITGYQADHYMPAMQDDRLVGALHRRAADAAGAGRPTPRPGSIGSTVNGDLGSLDLRPRAERRRVGLRHVPARPEGVAARDRPPRSQHADAGTAAAELSARAGDQRSGGAWPASTRSSSASGRPTDERLIGVLKAVREASGWQTRPSPSPKAAADRYRRRSPDRACR